MVARPEWDGHGVELDAEDSDRGSGARWDQAGGWARRLNSEAARRAGDVSTRVGRGAIVLAPTRHCAGLAP